MGAGGQGDEQIAVGFKNNEVARFRSWWLDFDLAVGGHADIHENIERRRYLVGGDSVGRKVD